MNGKGSVCLKFVLSNAWPLRKDNCFEEIKNGFVTIEPPHIAEM